LLPYSQLGIKSRVTHEKEAVTNDKVGYWGDNPGVPVIVPAGSVAVFSSVCFHRSGANTSDKMRRVILTQYSKAPIVNSFTGERLFQGIPFIENGNIVYTEKTSVS
jgi:ectoine hydroxylase-related dioxygenase (phytanoyl-CoA dioxygenase family)